MFIDKINFNNHPILGNLKINLINEKTGKPFPVVVFVGENGCGKTSILNEIFNYSKSKFIIDKATFDIKIGSYERPVSLFIRQDSKYCGAMNELTKVISGGKEPFPTNMNVLISEDIGYLNYTTRLNNCKYIDFEEFVTLFGDEKVANASKSNELINIKCGGEVLKMIDGSQTSIDLTTLSSGQQELLLKMREIRKVNSGTDFILFDEPETSLHPRWQRNILKNLIKLLQPEQGNDMYEPQIFVATHSEKVLESVIRNENVLIVRLYKNNIVVECERIEQMDLVLSHPTFAELDCVVFKINTFDYHNELFAELLDLISNGKENESIYDVERYVKKAQQYIENKNLYRKKWKADKGHSDTVTLPCYIRNYFHHPKKDRCVTDDELANSIKLLRILIKEIKR